MNTPTRTLEVTLDEAEFLLNLVRIVPTTRDLVYRLMGIAMELQADATVRTVQASLAANRTVREPSPGEKRP